MAARPVDRRLGWFVGLAVGLAIVTSHRAAQWSDNETLWNAASAVTLRAPQNLLMQAMFAWTHGRTAQARGLILAAATEARQPTRPHVDRQRIARFIEAWCYIIRGSSCASSFS